MKTIEIKDGTKTTIKIVPDDYTEPEYELEQKDLTTSERKSIGFSDVPRDKWKNIFKKKSA